MPDLNATSAMSANHPQNFSDWINSNYGSTNNWNIDSGYGIGGQIRNWMTGGSDKLRDEYQLYLDMNNRQYELDKINDARKWEEYMQSTQYQRMAKDLKAAGFNPGVVLSGGSGVAPSMASPTGSSNSSSAASFRRNNEAGDSSSFLGRLASTAMMALAMVATKGLAAKAGVGAGAKIVNNYYRR